MHKETRTDIVIFGLHCVFIEEMPFSIGRSLPRTDIVMLVAFIGEMLSSIW